MTEELKNARDRILVDNTAQAVFKHLDRIEDNRAALGARWIWELLQNARDAASGHGVRIRILVTETEFRFEHNGKPFASDEVAHLVYHGSTKIENFEDIGQFGSGFLTTHLLSRIVSVAGRLEDSSGFIFSLDRTGGTVEQLRDAMDRSWTAFERSVEDARSTPDATTSFAYEITEPGGRELAEAGLEDLRRCGPLALAFCPEISHITVETSSGNWNLSRGSRGEGGVLSFQYSEDGQALSRFVAVAEGEGDCCAALQLRTSESGLQVDPAQVTAAKLFVLFPLIGSERLGLPATVNSRRFKPREDRDGIVLAGDSPGARENRRLLEESVRDQERLLEWCAERKWAGAVQLLAFDTTHLPDWADGDPCFRRILTELVRKARATRLMPTPGGDWIEPHAAWVPTTDDLSHRERLWTLMSSWDGAQARLPCRDELVPWSRNLSGWARLLGGSREEMDEALTIAKVARFVANAKSVEGLERLLASGEALSWLVSLLELVRDAGDTGLLDEHNLLPTQAGSLRRRPDLRRDHRISEELKDIAEAFGVKIRDELLDKRAEMGGLSDLLVPAREPELLDRLLAHAKDECRDGAIKAPLVPWAVRLFRWMVVRPDYVERLEGFPVPTLEERDDGVAVLHLERGREASSRPLAPLAIWPEGARRFGSLFPRRRILAADFANGEPDIWVGPAASGYVNASPLVETKRVVEVFLPDEPLPERDGARSHKSTQEVEVSDLACLVEPDIGLIDMARKSRRRATEFIQFLVEFVTESDERAFEECSVDCECEESHLTYRAAWLAPLHRRRWVPLEASGRRAATASAESLASLLVDSQETSELLSGARGEKLLDALGISRADLALRVVAGGEEERLALIRSMQDLAAAAGDIDRVRELTTEIREHPEIIDSIEERKSLRRKIQRNQEIGRLVEHLLRQELEGCGLTVRRTGIGSDFEVESDFVENDEEMGLELAGPGGSTLIEVKSTRVDQVKMTPVQADRACSLHDRFALCVVPLDDDLPTGETIREQLRVVFDIGAHLESALSDYEALQQIAGDACRPRGAIELEIVEGEARFRIGRAIWEGALTFRQAVERFRRRG